MTDDNGEARRRRRRVDAHLHAARVHERAATTHDEAAELYERLGLVDKARHEHALAEGERVGAAADLRIAMEEDQT